MRHAALLQGNRPAIPSWLYGEQGVPVFPAASVHRIKHGARTNPTPSSFSIPADPHPFRIASAFSSFGISSIAYRSAVRGITALCSITKANTSSVCFRLASFRSHP